MAGLVLCGWLRATWFVSPFREPGLCTNFSFSSAHTDRTVSAPWGNNCLIWQKDVYWIRITHPTFLDNLFKSSKRLWLCVFFFRVKRFTCGPLGLVLNSSTRSMRRLGLTVPSITPYLRPIRRRWTATMWSMLVHWDTITLRITTEEIPCGLHIWWPLTG